MSSNPIVLAVLATGVGAGAWIDLRTRRVPNVLTLVFVVSGLACAAMGLSGLTVQGSLAGLGLGLALMLPAHIAGATGAGDVKLFAAAGAIIGPAHIALAFLYTALAGGVIAVVVATRRRRLALTLGQTAQLIATGAGNVPAIEHHAADNRFAYAPAIAVGTLLAALGF